MSCEQQQLEAGIAALEAQRAVLGDAVVDASVAGLRARLAALDAAPAQPAQPTQALRQVSILFVDVVGSTSLSQRLDPEETSAVLDDALARGTAVVEAHRGKVLQYAGDNILAAFGADATREDDAERAVRCGLALLEFGKALGAEVLAAHRHPGFNVRVGIHTGDVLLGGGVDAEGTIRGQAVHVAARMEQTAPAGALRISQDTCARVRGLFDVEAQAPLAVKGVDEPIASYLVVRAKPRSFRVACRGIEGVATRMVGRDAELEALQGAFKRLFVDQRLAAVTVVADAGIGKSRLLNEFDAWSATRPERFHLFRGRATPQTQGEPFGLLRDILARHLQITDDDTVEAARAKMEQGIVPLFEHDDGPDGAEGHAHLLGHLIGIEWRSSRHIRGILEDPRQIRNRAFHAAAQLFRRAGAGDGSPVVLQLEDLHWADGESLDFLNYVAEVNRDASMLVMAFARPTLFERRTDWRSTEGFHQRIDLGPLDKGYSRDLANEMLKKLPAIPAELRDLVTGSAEGNPFYMEELIRMLIDQGAIQTRTEAGEGWRLNAERLRMTQVPATLTGVLQARLDGLPPQEKSTLQEASVIGPVFWEQALVALDVRARETLPALVGRELALPQADAQFAGLREYAFRHQLLHQVTYDTVLKRSKRDLHGKVARWLAGLTDLRAGNFLGATAEHYDRAGDGVRAAEFHARAAEHALQRFGHDAVLTHVARALALLDKAPDAPLRWRLLDAREQTLGLQGRRDEQGRDVEALDRLAETMADDRKRAYVAWRRSHLALRRADWPECERSARSGMHFAERAGDDGLRLHALRLLAHAQAFQGDIEGGQALARRGLEEARRLGQLTNEWPLVNTLATVAGMQDDVTGALELHQQGLNLSREIGDRRSEGVSLTNVGLGWLGVGDLAQARRDLEAALQMLRANGDRGTEGFVLINLSSLALMVGEDARALALARSALDLAVAAQARDVEAMALIRLGNAELALGRHAAAHRAFEQSRARAIEIDDGIQHDAASGLVRVALAQGDTGAALRAATPVLDLVARGGTLDGTEGARLIELTCHRALRACGDPRAGEWLARAHDALQLQAATIADPAQRLGFLSKIPCHREILALWASRDEGHATSAARTPAVP